VELYLEMKGFGQLEDFEGYGCRQRQPLGQRSQVLLAVF
jgi:hypothetical protein